MTWALSTDEVREAYVLAADATDADRDNGEDFDHWLNRVRAEALREHGRVVAHWERGHSPKVMSHSLERIVADLEVRAAAIEQNSEGNGSE